MHRFDEGHGRHAPFGERVVDGPAVGFFVDKAVDRQLAQVTRSSLDIEVQCLRTGIEREVGLLSQQPQDRDAVVVGKAADDGFELLGFR